MMVKKDGSSKSDMSPAPLIEAQLLDLSVDLKSVVGPDYKYRYVNQAYVKAFGKTKDEMIGQHVASVIGEEVFETAVKAKLDVCLEGAVIEFEQPVRFEDGREHRMRVTYMPFAIQGE